MAAKKKQPDQEAGGGTAVAAGIAAVVESIALKNIRADEHNHRLQLAGPLKRQETERLKRLAASMQADGLLQPIVVYRDLAPGVYHRVIGSRRCAAAGLLGWTEISAHVLASIPTPPEIQRMRASENLDRADLSPAERALAIWELVEAHQQLQVGGRDRAIELTAADRGETASWVKDCLYVVDRLTPKSRELLAAGRLNLGQARVLATASGELQERLADDARWRTRWPIRKSR